MRLLVRIKKTYAGILTRLTMPRWKLIPLSLAVVIIAAEFAILASRFYEYSGHDLARVKNILTEAPDDLQAKLRFNAEQNSWLFNQDVKEQLPSITSDAAKVGGLTYSASLPAKLDKKSAGLILKDATNDLSMSFKPEFKVYEGKKTDGHVVYPLKQYNGQLVYTFLREGVKEDIILYKSPGNEAQFSYSLNLDKGLEARLQPDGSVGVFGGSDVLFGNISYGSDKDRSLVEKARKNSKKDTLRYVIPTPIVNGKNTKGIKSHFTLKDKTLTVHVSGLKNATYPLSIDPSFVMDTSVPCSWHKSGNNEGNIDYTGCQLKRSGIGGGKIGSWGAASSLNAPNYGGSVVAYNGYMYMLGGLDGGGGQTTQVQFAPINSSTGNVGPWNYTHNSLNDGATFVSGFSGGRANLGATAYGGYIYIAGGLGGSVVGDVQYAKLNSDGTVGAWTTDADSSMTSNRYGFGLEVYAGRMYAIGGCASVFAGQCNAPLSSIERVSINGDGSLGTWTTSGNSSMTTTRFDMATAVYNGYLYAITGCVSINLGNCTTLLNTVEYAPINTDGTVGTWKLTNGFAEGRRYATSAIHNGYLYMIGGAVSGNNFNNDVWMAKIYANGEIGPWATTASFTTARNRQASVSYNGYVYIAGGCTNNNLGCSGGVLSDVQYSTISSTLGDIGSFTTDSDPIMASNGIRSHASVVYGGYIYVLGGNNTPSTGITYSNQVRYAPLNADGSVGGWAGTNAFAIPRTELAAVAHNGYMYVIGGQTSNSGPPPECPGGYCTDIQKATINSDGTLGSWSSAGGAYSSQGRDGLGAVVYNGYVYVMGGNYNSNSSISAEIDIAPFNADGSVGTWNSTNTLNLGGRSNFGLAQSGKYIYLLGGRAPGSFEEVNAWRATLGDNGVISSWTNTGFSLPENRHWMAANTYNGYLYIAGGQTANGISWSIRNDVKYIKINMSDGSLTGGWTTSPVTLPAVRASQGGVMNNGIFYNTGGCASLNLGSCNSSFNNVVYTQIYNGGGGAVTGWTTTGTTSLPVARRGHGTVVYNGYIYVLSGVDGNNGWTASVYYSPITSSGNGTWATTNTWLDVPGVGASFVAYNGYMYKIGGDPNNGTAAQLNDVQYAPINTDGTLGTWKYTWDNTSGTTKGGGLILGRKSFAATAYNGRLYVSGGCINHPLLGNCTITNTTETAAINADGTVGTWSTVGTNLPSNRWHHRMTTYNGYMYVIAGCEVSTSARCDSRTARVDYARTNSSGLDADAGCGAIWCRTTNIPMPMNGFSAYAYSGYLYIFGGERTQDVPAQTVSYAPIYANGTLGSWSTSAEPLPAGRTQLGAGGTHNGKFFIVAGCGQNDCNLGSATSTIYQAGPQSTPQIARHSILLTTDARTLPANFFSTVSPQNTGSSVDVTVSTANDPAVTLNSLGINRRIGSTTKYPLSPGNDGTKYYWLQFVLDDTQTYTWGETATPSTVSYFQLNYHPNPGMRLRGGKMFNQNQQQSLDAY